MTDDQNDHPTTSDATNPKDGDDAGTEQEASAKPASADEPGVAPHGVLDDDGPGGNEDGASSDGDSGPAQGG